MKYLRQFPRPVREIMTEWIPMPDGTRLAARIWLPEDAERNPVPAILEYIPYRRRDFTAFGDAINHRYLAGHGYACLRVDIRGNGDSGGLMLDEYDHPELDDGKEVIAWIARQPWCTGKVGMLGLSWGGFNGLQIAALRPPALKAVVTVGSTDDRYHGDVHFMGGCLLDSNMNWGTRFFSNTTRPPDPAIVGEGWREQWLDRLRNMRLAIETWLSHPRRDAYWKHGSVCEDFSRIEAATYTISGFADGYSNSVFSIFAGLRCPKKALIGPWGHAYPHLARPGPQIGFLQEILRWYDFWLKDIDTGIMREPAVRAWMQESVPPQVSYDVWPGRWIAESDWPGPGVREEVQFLAANRIAPQPGPESPLRHRSPLTLGVKAAQWGPHGRVPDMSDDQRSDDGQSLCFDGEALHRRTEIFGAPIVELDLAVDRPQAFLVVRLNEVAPDGASLRVSYGVLNLAHRESHEFPSALEPGRRTRVRLKLNEVAHAFPAGRRLRVAISTNYWPVLFPSPEPVTLTVFGGRLILPVRDPRPEIDDRLAPFGEPEGAAPMAHRVVRALRPVNPAIRREEDVATGEVRIVQDLDRGSLYLADADLTYDLAGEICHRIVEGDNLSPSIEVRVRQKLGRAGWDIATEARTRLTATATEFLLDASVDAYEGGARIFNRVWSSRLPRDFL